MSNLPKGWIEVPLMEFIQYLPTGVPFYSGEKEYFSTGSIQNSNYEPEGKFTFNNKPSRANRLSRIGDVIQARMKGTDKGLLIDDSLNDKLFSTGFIQLRPYEETYEKKLLYYFVKSEIFIDQKDEFATGSTQEALTDAKAKELKILVPPLNEQHRIVAKLDKLLSKVETAKARLNTLSQTLKRFRQAVLSSAVSGELTKDMREKNGINNDWEEIQLVDLVSNGGIFDGPFGSNLKTSDYVDKGIRVIRLENIGHLKFILDKYSYISKQKYLTLRKHTVYEKDILFSSFITEEIRACMLPPLQETSIAKADCFCIRPLEDKVDKTYLLLQLVSNSSFSKLTENIHGATRPRINLTQLKRLPILVCSLREQQEIVRRAEKFFKFADQIEARYIKAKQYTDKLTQSILAKAFRGELVPQDSKDEPAEKLLEKIKTEKKNR